jgi:LmbE family N-acetylglucosaminyl deacetylase
LKLRIGRPRTALIVAPHPDDETIGAWGLMRALRRRGTEVRVLVVTAGGASHAPTARWPKARLESVRRKETRAVMRKMGIVMRRQDFLGLPDGGLAELGPKSLGRLSRAVRQIPRLDLVVGPVPGDDHADHRVVAAALTAIRIPGVRRLGYQVWPVTSRPQGRIAHLSLNAAERAAKAVAIRAYRSQTRAVHDDADGFRLTPAQIAAFARRPERFASW